MAMKSIQGSRASLLTAQMPQTSRLRVLQNFSTVYLDPVGKHFGAGSGSS